MQEVRSLYDLQELDQQVSAGEESLANVRERLADESRINAARERVENLTEQLEGLSTKQKAEEEAVAGLQEGLQRLESRLYGGAITGTRELSAAEDEREFISGQLAQAEETLLEVMVGVEDVQANTDQAQDALATLEASRPAERKELMESEKALRGELARLGQSRDEIAPSLSRRALSLYDALYKSKNGQAVARVERGMCQGCRLTLSTMELQQARSAQGIVRCSSCSRILYVV